MRDTHRIRIEFSILIRLRWVSLNQFLNEGVEVVCQDINDDLGIDGAKEMGNATRLRVL